MSAMEETIKNHQIKIQIGTAFVIIVGLFTFGMNVNDKYSKIETSIALLSQSVTTYQKQNDVDHKELNVSMKEYGEEIHTNEKLISENKGEILVLKNK